MITPPAIKDRETVLAKWQAVIDKTFDIFSWTSHHELAWLAECASQATEIVEIGSYHGKSAVVMALANPAATIQAIDQPQDERCGNILDANADPFDRLFIHFGTSSEVRWDDGCAFDFAFIDGGHKEIDVATDIKNLLPHMASGAIMSGHDWRPHDMNDGVNQAVIRAFGMPNTFESIWWIHVP